MTTRRWLYVAATILFLAIGLAAGWRLSLTFGGVAVTSTVVASRRRTHPSAVAPIEAIAEEHEQQARRAVKDAIEERADDTSISRAERLARLGDPSK